MVATRNDKNSLPYIIINMAMSADGKIATADRAIHSFGSSRDLDNLYKLRAQADAVMCGARTAEIDGVTLGTGGEKYKKMRIKNKLAPHHIRIIVSGSGSINTNAEVFKSKISPIILITKKSIEDKILNKLRNVSDDVILFGDKEIDFKKALAFLKEKWNVNVLICEGGGELNSSLLKLGLVNEIYVTICPYIFGGEKAPTIADGDGITLLKNAVNLKLISGKLIESEVFLHYRVEKKS